MTYVWPYSFRALDDDEKCLRLKLGEKGTTIQIVGSTEEAILETAEIFMAAKTTTMKNTCLEVNGRYGRFSDFRSARPHCLRRLFLMHHRRVTCGSLM